MQCFQPEYECMPPEKMRALQLERLQALLSYVYENIPFYHDSFDAAGFDPSSLATLEDVEQIPFTLKQDMRDAYPFGMFAVPRKDVVRIHASSGTTGTATVVGYTQHDLDMWADCFARCLVEDGATNESVVQIAYGYGLFTGGLGAHYGTERLGATALPMSSGNTKRQIQLMQDFQSDILACTPSYALNIADTAIEAGLDPARDFSLSGAILGGEPSSNGVRHEIEEKLGLNVVDVYGLSEILGPGVACECTCHSGLHVADDHFLVEIIDPVTLKHVEPGEWGELVVTTLTKECSPLVRYRTRDITRIIPGKPCACGRTNTRIDRMRGRSDDMLIIRGVNVFPSQIEQVITKFSEVASHYQIVLTTKGVLDEITLRVEPVETFDFDEVRKIEDLQHRITAELKSELQIKVNVRVVEPRSIERYEGKAKRVLDLREKGE